MANFGLISIIFVSLTFSSIVSEQLYCLQSSGKNKEDIKPLPDKYKVNIEFVDQLKNFTADIVEYYSKADSLSSMKCDLEKDRFDCIYNRTSNVFSFVNKTLPDDFSCQTSIMSEKMPKESEPSFFFPDELIKTPKPIMGLIDLFELFKNSVNVSVDNLHMNETHDHGLPVQHYIGCDKTKDGNFWMEFLVCITKKEFSYAGGEKVAEVPTRIELKVYDAKNASTETVQFNAIYELFAYRTNFDEQEEENHQLPPRGVHCDGMKNTKDLPALPKNFSVSVEYIDHENKRVDGSEIFYDSIKHITAFEVFHANKDEAISKGLRDATIGHNRIVHDFNTGVQYILNGLSGHCINVTGIPSEVGDVELVDRKLGMKNEFEMLFTLDPKNFVYVGQRYENMPLDVWTASATNGKDEKIVYEVYFSVDRWKLEDGYMKSTNSLPVYFKVYHKDNKGSSVTIQHFHDLTIYGDQNGLFWPKLDVFPCLNLTAQSYYMIQLNGTMKILKDIGIHVVTSYIKEELAQMASNISILRIGHVNYIEDKNGFVNVSFGIAEKYAGSSTPTNFSAPEVDASTAINNINKSLMADNHKFTIGGLEGQTLYLAMLKGSFVVSRYYPPEIRPVIQTFKGYTGGSMAAMGIFMLLIGGVAGVVLAFVYLKRHRGGIAYQIYE